MVNNNPIPRVRSKLEIKITNVAISALIAIATKWLFDLLVADYYGFKHVPFVLILIIVALFYEVSDMVLTNKKVDRIYQSTVLREMMTTNLYLQYILEAVYQPRTDTKKVDIEEKVA